MVKTFMKALRLFISMVLLLIISIIVCSCEIHKHTYSDWNVSEPSCIVNGISYRICSSCGDVEYGEIKKANGHMFSEWTDNIQMQTRYSVCSSCGLQIENGEYKNPTDVPVLYFYGNPNGSEVEIDIQYQTNNVTTKLVGITRLDSNRDNSIYKKDYDFFIYDDKQNKSEKSVQLDERVGEYSAFTLKAEYSDMSGIRNIALSDIWSQIVSSRSNLDENLKKLPHFGADFGYPALFYTNDNFKGLYNICAPNDEKLFGLSDQNKHALVYTYTDFKLFDFRYSNGAYGNKIPCVVIYPNEEDKIEDIHKSFNEFAKFVNESSDTEFRKNISKHLDIDAAIDYIICLYAFGIDENASLYCNWVTYNRNKWIPSLYNLTTSMGIDKNGNYISPDDTYLPYIGDDGILYSGTAVTLWDRVCKNYRYSIIRRYNELRKNILSTDNVKNVFDSYISLIPQCVYNAELDEYPEKNLLNGQYSSDLISEWFDKKCELLDSAFELK